MFIQLLSSVTLFVLPVVVYLIVQKKWRKLRNRLYFMAFLGLIFTLTLYVPLHEVGHVVFTSISGIQVTGTVLFFVTETGLRKPVVDLNLDNLDTAIYTPEYVLSSSGGILFVSLVFLTLSLLFFFKKHDALYFSVLPILKSFFEVSDLENIGTSLHHQIVPYFIFCGIILLFIYFLMLLDRDSKKENKISKRLLVSFGLTFIFVLFFMWNPLYLSASLFYSLNAHLSQIPALVFIQILGWVLIALSVVFVCLLFPPIRRKLKEISLFGGRHTKIAQFYETHLHSLVIVRQILLFLIPTAVTLVLPVAVSVISKHFLSLIVLGLSLLIFVSIQLPLLMKAHILVTFEIDYKKQNSSINFELGKTSYVEVGIHNLGFNTYKNFTVIFYFGKDFEIVPYNNSLYGDLDFKKEFHVQKRHGEILFNPKDNFLTIPPQEVVVFPFWVKVPNKEVQVEMTIWFHSENTWGMNCIRRQVKVTKTAT